MNPTPAPSTITFEVWLTTAPAAYDGQGTIEANPAPFICDRDGNPLRTVWVRPAASKWQIARYASGMFAVYTEAQVQEMQR